MTGDFLDNRLVSQSYFSQSLFLVPHLNGDISIVEKANQQKVLSGQLVPNELVEVVILNVPSDEQICSTFSTSTLILDMEHSRMPFVQPNGCKAVEKAIVYMSRDTMHVILCEMKSGLKFDTNSKSGIGRNGIYQKILDSITRFCTFLPMFFDDSCVLKKLRFHAAIFYNYENLARLLTNPENKREIEAMDLYPAFQQRLLNGFSQVYIQDHYGVLHQVNVAFIKNSGLDSNKIDIEFDNLKLALGIT